MHGCVCALSSPTYPTLELNLPPWACPQRPKTRRFRRPYRDGPGDGHSTPHLAPTPAAPNGHPRPRHRPRGGLARGRVRVRNLRGRRGRAPGPADGAAAAPCRGGRLAGRARSESPRCSGSARRRGPGGVRGGRARVPRGAPVVARPLLRLRRPRGRRLEQRAARCLRRLHGLQNRRVPCGHAGHRGRAERRRPGDRAAAAGRRAVASRGWSCGTSPPPSRYIPAQLTHSHPRSSSAPSPTRQPQQR